MAGLFMVQPRVPCHSMAGFRRLVATSSAISGTTRTRAAARIKEIDNTVPFSPSLVDSFNRRHDYLRISLTERCNLRCFYCMPSEGIELSPAEHILRNDEILRLARLFVKSGVTKIRLTGGEPTIRKDIHLIISGLNELRQHGLKSIAMTSNGISLHRKLPQFIANGLSHLNLSLDTLDPFKFELITRRRGHEAVMKVLEDAVAAPELQSVKVNVVVVKGLNDSEVLDFVEMTKNKRMSVRFIEFMPFTGNKWDKNKMVPSTEMLSMISARHGHIERLSDEVNDTARSWRVPGYIGTFGFISSMSDHFCSSCNRLRITADGQIKVCLFDAKEVSLRDNMRAGATDAELLRIIGHAVSGKAEKHEHMEDIDVTNNRPMILIGGLNTQNASNRRKHMLPYQFPSSTPRHEIGLARAFSTSARLLTERLTHIDDAGRPTMVDVSNKSITKRTATASGRIFIPAIAYRLVTDALSASDHTTASTKSRHKGDALAVAQLAAIMASKKTSDLIPLCHPLSLSNISVAVTPHVWSEEDPLPTHITSRYSIVIEATVATNGATGVEMEALTAVSVGLLTVWDMLKAVAGKEMEIGEIVVTKKTGGKSEDFERLPTK